MKAVPFAAVVPASVHVSRSKLYSTSIPLSFSPPKAHWTITDVDDALAARLIIGAEGKPIGIAGVVAVAVFDATLGPCAFCAVTRYQYCVEGAQLVSSNALSVGPTCANELQVEPLSVDLSTLKNSWSLAGNVHPKWIVFASVALAVRLVGAAIVVLAVLVLE